MSKSRVFLLPLFLLLSACGEMPKLEVPSFGIADSSLVYRQDIRQGNFITQEMVSQLKPGLTREQVRYVLGTPLVTDPFHANRWDYIYRYDNGKGDTQQRNFSVYFDDNKLTRVGGDVAPAVAAPSIAETAKPAETAAPAQAPAQVPIPSSTVASPPAAAQ